MPDFIKNNRFGLGAGLMVTLLATAFGGEFGLLPMLLGGLSFALVGGALGKDENGILSGLFKKSEPASTPTGDSPAPDAPEKPPTFGALLEQNPATDTDVNRRLPKRPPASSVQINPFL